MRLNRKDPITVGEKTKYAGLGAHLNKGCAKCGSKQKKQFGCQKFGNDMVIPEGGSKWKIDDGGSVDYTRFCPLSTPLDSLVKQVYWALRISDVGGLDRYFKKPMALIPHITVYFYQLVLGAHGRYSNEKSEARRQMVERQAREKNTKAARR